MRVDVVANDPAEELAANAEPLAVPAHGAGRLALERRRIDGALARHDELSGRGQLVEANRLEDELGALHELCSQRRERRGSRLDTLHARLTALSPAATLERGYAIVRRGDDVVRSASQVERGDPVSIRVADGTFGARVD